MRHTPQRMRGSRVEIRKRIQHVPRGCRSAPTWVIQTATETISGRSTHTESSSLGVCAKFASSQQGVTMKGMRFYAHEGASRAPTDTSRLTYIEYGCGWSLDGRSNSQTPTAMMLERRRMAVTRQEQSWAIIGPCI